MGQLPVTHGQSHSPELRLAANYNFPHCPEHFRHILENKYVRDTNTYLTTCEELSEPEGDIFLVPEEVIVYAFPQT